MPNQTSMKERRPDNYGGRRQQMTPASPKSSIFLSYSSSSIFSYVNQRARDGGK